MPGTFNMIATVDSAALIQCEIGTGKEVIARAIHEAGSRRKNRLVALNRDDSEYAAWTVEKSQDIVRPKGTDAYDDRKPADFIHAQGTKLRDGCGHGDHVHGCGRSGRHGDCLTACRSEPEWIRAVLLAYDGFRVVFNDCHTDLRKTFGSVRQKTSLPGFSFPVPCLCAHVRGGRETPAPARRHGAAHRNSRIIGPR